MIQSEINKIYDDLWDSFQSKTFPISMQDIIELDFLDNFIKHYFKTETELYCKKFISNMVSASCIDTKLLESEDSYQLQQIIFDWVRFNIDDAKNILRTALQLRINYIFDPIQTISKFIFSNKEEQEKNINSILEELDFLDKDFLISALQNELLDLQNEKDILTYDEFSELIKDMYLNLAQNQNINEFLFPIKSYFNITKRETLTLEELVNYFTSRDLTGIVNEISNFANSNNLGELDYEQIVDILKNLFGVSDDAPPELTQDTQEAQPEDFLDDSDLNELDNNSADTTSESISVEENTLEEVASSVATDTDAPHDDNSNNNYSNNYNNSSYNYDNSHDDIIETLNQMRSENKTNFEIELKYLELEKVSIEQFDEKIKLL